MFDKTAHSRLRDAAPPKNLHRVPCRILRAPCMYIFRKAIWSARLVACSLYDWNINSCHTSRPDDTLECLTILHIWYVTFSSQACTASARAIIAASFARTTACELSGLPNALCCETHLRHSSTISRCARADAQIITQRSWLKLLKITKIPPPSGPSVFSTGTRTLSKVTKAVPAVGE